MTKNAAIGIDIGGTKISLILGDEKGKILVQSVIPTQTGKATSKCLKQLFDEVGRLVKAAKQKKCKLQGIGVGIPGAVNSARGVVPRSPNLKGWKGYPLAANLKKKFDLPVILCNDANVAALAEKHFGQAKHCKDFIYLTVSTGIGGGLIANHQLIEGASYVGGEIGHMTLVPGGNLCKCGQKGCLEAYASGTAIAKYVKDELRKGRKSVLKKAKKITTKEIGQAARKGDRLSLEAFSVAGFYLGVGVANLLNVLNPELISFGGGVWKSAPASFMRVIKENCKEYAWPEAYRKVKFVRSKIKGSIGDLGALALVFETAGQRRN